MKFFFFTLTLTFIVGMSYGQNNFPATGSATVANGNYLILSDPNVNAKSGITWFPFSPESYGITRTPGTWTTPNFQQMNIEWATGIILNPGNAYGKSYVEIINGGLRVTSGNVGIGIINPQNKLDVNGTIHSRAVVVNVTGWPDFVFKKNYALKPLSAVQAFIENHNHLPEIPSATEIESNGQNLGEMNKLLLKKVEELTLYLIDIDKQFKTQNSKMQNQIKAQNKQIAILKNRK